MALHVDVVDGEMLHCLRNVVEAYERVALSGREVDRFCDSGTVGEARDGLFVQDLVVHGLNLWR